MGRFIRLIHAIKHACVQTINSKEDNDELSSTRSGTGARMRTAGEGACRFLDTMSKSRRPCLASIELQTRSYSIPLKSPLQSCGIEMRFMG